MIVPSLPPRITAALDARLHGLSRSDAARRAETISHTYRAGGTSSGIRSDADALAYAIARMPATYAAVAATLNALRDIRPGFAPRRLIDCGAGPGTATWAACESFPAIETIAMLDANPALRALALDLADPMGPVPDYSLSDAMGGLATTARAELVIASYVVTEIATSQQQAFIDALWARTDDVLLIVEPGTPAGYARIRDIRTQLIARGASIIAPCPHEAACPIVAPDWCHFSQRLSRSRAHKALKSADRPFEDEKFSYVAVGRNRPENRPSRILARPVETKPAIAFKLCTPAGTIAPAIVPKRDKGSFRAAKHLDWGDGFPILTPSAHPDAPV